MAIPLLIAAALLGRQPNIEALTLSRITYQKWPNAVRLSNGKVELIFVAQIGRVMRYGYVGGPNILWENPSAPTLVPKPGQWANYGGDKLWPAPQSDWNWPPDPAIDGSFYRTIIRANKLFVGMMGKSKPGVSFTRLISMNPDGSVKFENQLLNAGPKTQELAVWQITQVSDPDRVIVPIEASDEMPNGWALFDTKPVDPLFASVHGKVLWARRNPKAAFKLGSPSAEGALTAIRGNSEFRISAAKVASGRYPDGGKFLQFYANPDPDKYVELEVTGPLTTLKPGESTTLEVTWSLQEMKDSDG